MITPKVNLRLTEVLQKYNLSIDSLVIKNSKIPRYTLGRQEVSYVLATEFNFLRKDIAKVLNCKMPQVTYLIKLHCKRNRLSIPRHIPETHPAVEVQNYIENNKRMDGKTLKGMLMVLYSSAYRSGYQKGRKFKGCDKNSAPLG